MIDGTIAEVTQERFLSLCFYQGHPTAAFEARREVFSSYDCKEYNCDSVTGDSR